MIGTLSALLSPLFSGFILMIGFGLIGILLPVRMGLEGMGTDTVGLVLSMYAVGMLLGGLYSKALINRVGHIRVFAASAALAAIGILACGLYTHAILWGLMRALLGFCNACAFAAIDSWLSGSATAQTRGRILATNQISVMTAIFIGQFALNVADPGGNTLFVLAGMLLSLAVIPMVMSRSAGPPIEEGGSMPVWRLFGISPLGAVSCLFAGVLYNGSLNMLPLFASNYGIEGVRLSQFMGAAVIGALLLQFPVGYLSDRIDRRTLMLGLLLCSAFASLAVPMAAMSGDFRLMMLSVAVAIGIVACLYPMGISETFDKVQQQDLISAMGSLIAIYAIGSIIGPYSASLVMAHFGVNQLFGFLAVTEALLLLFVLYRMQVRDALPIEDQEAYVPMVYETGNAFELDPRSEFQPLEERLGAEARYALAVADDQPGFAVNIAKSLGVVSPRQAARLAGAMSQVDGVNALRLYNTISDAMPESKVDIAEAVASASPEFAADIIRRVSEEDPDNVTDYVEAMSRAAPEVGMDAVAAAAEAIVDESPEDVVELAQMYAEAVSDHYDELRPIDREDENPEEWASEVVSQLSEVAPGQSEALASTVAEVVPEAAPQIASDYAEKLVEEEGTEPSDGYQAVGDFVSRMATVVPEQAVALAAAVVEAIPDSASDVIEALQRNNLQLPPAYSDLEDRPEDWEPDVEQ